MRSWLEIEPSKPVDDTLVIALGTAALCFLILFFTAPFISEKRSRTYLLFIIPLIGGATVFIYK